MSKFGYILILCGYLIPSPCEAREWEYSGNFATEYRFFYESPIKDNLKSHHFSISIEPEFRLDIDELGESFTFKPLVRIDSVDDDRTHLDIQELKWQIVSDAWELVVGFDTVFWGVTETIHLVNVINQIDQVESIDQEDFLGQPMVNLTLINDWGDLDVFIMPYFRERTFVGVDGRPGASFRVSNDKSRYQSNSKEWHTDLAVRWSNTIDEWDVGISHFYGTSRDPRFSSSAVDISKDDLELIPIYDLIHQSGVDVQATFGAWLFKLEAIHRSGQEDSFTAYATGFEYTFFDVASTGKDIGIISEYKHDERNFSISNNDFSFGVRLAINGVSSSQLIAAISQDIDNASRSFYVEMSRRIGNSYRLSVEARGISNVDPDDALFVFKTDNYVQVELAYYF
jgi:hypothetical protein